jgi:hypothetical protein
MLPDNHIASAWPSLFSVQLFKKFSLSRTRSIATHHPILLAITSHSKPSNIKLILAWKMPSVSRWRLTDMTAFTVLKQETEVGSIFNVVSTC